MPIDAPDSARVTGSNYPTPGRSRTAITAARMDDPASIFLVAAASPASVPCPQSNSGCAPSQSMIPSWTPA